MNENKKSRKEWVKNAAIVFLAVMLVLTFFSNTIMNYSLPEVATQYIEPGSISAQIRGTGTVESGDPYNVKVKGTSKVESIEVTVGDVVQKGDILMYLSYEDSDALKLAKSELEAAELAFDMALLTGGVDAGVMKNAGSTLSTEAYKTQIISLKNEITLAEKEVKAAQTDVDELTRWGEALSTQLSVTPTYGDTDVSQAETEAASAKQRWEAAKSNLEKNYPDSSVSANDPQWQSGKKAAEEAEKTAKTEYDNAVAKENSIKNAINTTASLNSQQKTNTVNLFHATNVLEDKQKILTEKQEALADYVKYTSDSINLSTQYKAVVEAQKKVAELQEQAAGSEVVAPISGTITSVNVTSGLDTPADGIVVSMQPEGEGYTMSFSVTNEQARTLNVGQEASLVNSWRYDDLTVTLIKIMPDKTDPSQKKLLLFDVKGENVFAGQTLNVSVGQRSSNYDMLVPNSAIREDNNGKFILIVTVKNSPLGNRYKATRADVEVIASDDTKSAITGAVNSYEYVITTSNLPVQAGDYVRLPEN